MTVGSPKNGASIDAEANFDENSPKTKCCERSSINPNAAVIYSRGHEKTVDIKA
jgi:hypothetical protein